MCQLVSTQLSRISWLSQSYFRTCTYVRRSGDVGGWSKGIMKQLYRSVCRYSYLVDVSQQLQSHWKFDALIPLNSTLTSTRVGSNNALSIDDTLQISPASLVDKGIRELVEAQPTSFNLRLLEVCDRISCGSIASHSISNFANCSSTPERFASL